MVLVTVRYGKCEQALRDLKRKMQRELVFRVMKMSRFHEPASLKRVRKQQETERRRRKVTRRQRTS